MSFKAIRGHKTVLESLKARLASGRVPHAMLFTGPQGVGKFTTAIEFAKALVCEKKGPDACDECRHCRKITSGAHPDFFVIRPNDKNNILIADVREAIARTRMKPFEAASHAVVLDSAENMGDEAQNALLKVLEEPPPGVHFVLVSAEPHLLYATVLSRCQRISFDALSDADVASILAEKEGIERADAEKLGRLGRGSVSQAIEAGDVDFREAENRVFEYVAAAKSRMTVEATNTKLTKKEAMFEFDRLTDIFRDLLLMKAAPQRATGIFYSDRLAELGEAAGKYSIDEIDSILETLGEAREGAEQSLNLKLIYLKLWDEMGLKVPV